MLTCLSLTTIQVQSPNSPLELGGQTARKFRRSTPPSDNVHVTCCSYFWLRSLVFLFPFPLFKLTFHPNSGSCSYSCSFGWSIEDLAVNLSYTVSFFIWVLFGSWENWWSLHILDWWYDCSWLIISWVDFLLTIFFSEEQKKWNAYDFSFPFLLCSYRFFSFAIDSEPAIELFLCCCLELLSKIWVI